MSKRTVILILVLLAVTAALLALALYSKPKSETTQAPGKPVDLPYAQTTLKLSDPLPGNTGSSTSDVMIDTGSNEVTAVQIELSFDPSQLTDVQVRPGTFFAEPTELIKKIDNENGTVSYALTGALGQKGTKGKGTVAIITFKETGQTGDLAKINFESKSKVTAMETDQSVLKSATGITFNITSSADTQTNTGTPSAQ